ncbi:MAG: hypothetical protein ACI4WR_00145 [Bulleidia sp.]
MLGKLLKYDFLSIGRILLPLYGAILVAAALVGISSRTTDVSLTIMTIYMFLVMAAMILTVVLVIQRFYNNLLGREGYLMFTIPVSTGSHILAKVLTALIWGFLGVIAVVLSGVLILALDPSLGGFAGIGEMMHAFFQIRLDPQDVKDLVLSGIIMVLQLTAVITRIYAAIAVGHLWSGHRILGAFLAYIGLQILVFLAVSRIGITFLPDAFMNGQTAAAEILIQMCEIAIFGALTWVVLDRRLNLE